MDKDERQEYNEAQQASRGEIRAARIKIRQHAKSIVLTSGRRYARQMSYDKLVHILSHLWRDNSLDSSVRVYFRDLTIKRLNPQRLISFDCNFKGNSVAVRIQPAKGGCEPPEITTFYREAPEGYQGGPEAIISEDAGPSMRDLLEIG